MTHMICHCLIAALDRTRWETATRSPRVEPAGLEHLLSIFSVLIALGVLAWFALRLFSRRERGARSGSPWRLFFSLCRAHRLNWRERWLLWRVVRAGRLPSPAMVFVSPETLEPSALPPAFQAQAILLARLRQRLFGQG